MNWAKPFRQTQTHAKKKKNGEREKGIGGRKKIRVCKLNLGV